MLADDVSLAGAAIAFHLVWAFFPALVVLVIFSALLLGKGQVLWVLSQMRLELPDSFNVLLVSQLDVLAQRSRAISLGTIAGALAFSLWSGMRGVRALMNVLNRIYGERESRSLLHRLLVALALCGLGGLFVLLALSLIIGLAGTGSFDDDRMRLALWRWPILSIALMLSLSAIYRHGPCRRTPRWRWVTVGAAISAALWLCGSVAVSYYVAHYGKFNPVLGTLASVVVFLFWCYLSVLVVLLGAQVNAELERQR